MRTSTLTPAAPKWYVIDAEGEHLGRLSTRIARVINGKHKPEYSPHQIHSDHVIIVNAEKIVLTGNKAEQKEYFSHSGYLGHMKKTPFARLFAKKPAAVLEHSIRGMVARNKLREKKMDFLHVFAGSEHPHSAQQPQPLPKFDTK